MIAPKPNNPDTIRYCPNMRPPNKAIKRPVTEVPSAEAIAVKLNGSTAFSKLDMNEGYHQIELEEESCHVTTSCGGNGKKRYTCLNHGTLPSRDTIDNVLTRPLEIFLVLYTYEMTFLLVACPRKGTWDYKLLLAGSRLYVNGIINGNMGMCPSNRHPIPGVKDSQRNLHGKSNKVMELTLSLLTSVLQIAFVLIQ